MTATKTLSNIYMVLEYCNGGDLEKFLEIRGGYFKEEEARFIIR